MIALRQLALPEVAGQQRVAVTIHAIGEVLARHADNATFPTLQVAIVNKIPLLHRQWPLVHKYQYRRVALGNYRELRAGLRSIFRASTKKYLKSNGTTDKATAF